MLAGIATSSKAEEIKTGDLQGYQVISVKPHTVGGKAEKRKKAKKNKGSAQTRP